ncbi:MAG: lysophospholipid acyltransferase family protein [Nocardioides sp.]
MSASRSTKPRLRAVVPRWYPATVALGRIGMRALDVTLRTEGGEHIPTDGPGVVATTHSSYLDFIPVAAAARGRGREVRFFIRGEVWPVFKLHVPLSGMGHIPVDRGAPAAAYLHARRHLLAGELVGIFPEAGMSYSYTVRALMKGAAALARETGAPIIPAGIWGAQRIYTIGRPRPGRRGPQVDRRDFTRGRVVDLRFGAPIQVAPADDLVEVTTALGHRLTGLLESVQRRPEHRPAPGEYAEWYPAHLGGHAPDRAEAVEYDSVPRAAVPPTWGPRADELGMSPRSGG